MQRKEYFALGAAAAFLVLMASAFCTPASAAPPDAAGIASQGNGHGAPPCASCHGAQGGGQAAAGFPRLAGLNAVYLERQLDDFANGTRENAVMKPIASALSEDERKALAGYYSRLPVPARAATPASSSPADNDLGQRLALRGRWKQQVPGCVQCHGPHGIGVGANFPPLAGQPAQYIADQLQAWKHGSRSNDPLDLMKHVASVLDAKDIEAVSRWFAAQPATTQGGKP